MALSLGWEKVKYAEYEGPAFVALYGLFVFTTTLVISPYYPKYSGALSASSFASSGASPITYTRFFYMTRKFASFLILSLVSVEIESLFVPFGGMNPKDFRVFTVLTV
jgi:hypothetical protein